IFMVDYNVNIKIVEEKDVNDKVKKSNLIIVGYPEKSSLMMEMAPHLPIDLSSDIIELGKLAIKNEKISGMFICENPYNKETLSVIIFFDDELESLAPTKTSEIDGEVYIYSEPIAFKY